MTTFVLGAGASRHVGYPLAKSMGPALFDWMKQKGTLGCYDARAAAKCLRGDFNEPEDIEQLLTQVDAIILDGVAADRRRRDQLVNHDKPALVASIREWFSEIREHPADAYRTFSHQVLQAGDCIISFNYDNSLERELKLAGHWALGDGYGFPIENLETGSKIRVLKLHGSTNWIDDVSFPPRPLVSDSDLNFLGYPGEHDESFANRGSVSAVFPLILPTACKRFYLDTSLGRVREEFWNRLWDTASRCITNSTRVVICGYSLPSIDERACSLLLNTERRARVEVCCGSDTDQLVGRFRASGYREVSEASARLFDSLVVRTGIRTHFCPADDRGRE